MMDTDADDQDDQQKSSSSSSSSAQYVACGDTITADAGCLMSVAVLHTTISSKAVHFSLLHSSASLLFSVSFLCFVLFCSLCRGHGTMQSGGNLIATVSGFVERVNKLISVRPLHSRYGGEVGDVVVGRVVELGDKRWKLDVGGRQHAILLLSSVNLPGGVQRRRTAEDSLNMRSFFTENDCISAEVQKVRHDGNISLHTRNLKYGKLANGQMIRVAHNLIKRCKQHFQLLGDEIGVEVILGMNGYIWIQEAPIEREKKEEQRKAFVSGESRAAAAAAAAAVEADQPTHYTPVTVAGRERVCRVRNSILALARQSMPIYHVTIADVYLASISLGMAAKEMCQTQQNIVKITQAATERVQQSG